MLTLRLRNLRLSLLLLVETFLQVRFAGFNGLRDAAAAVAALSAKQRRFQMLVK